MAEILGTYPKARTSEADDAVDKAKRENGYTAFDPTAVGARDAVIKARTLTGQRGGGQFGTPKPPKLKAGPRLRGPAPDRYIEDLVSPTRVPRPGSEEFGEDPRKEYSYDVGSDRSPFGPGGAGVIPAHLESSINDEGWASDALDRVWEGQSEFQVVGATDPAGGQTPKEAYRDFKAIERRGTTSQEWEALRSPTSSGKNLGEVVESGTFGPNRQRTYYDNGSEILEWKKSPYRFVEGFQPSKEDLDLLKKLNRGQTQRNIADAEEGRIPGTPDSYVGTRSKDQGELLEEEYPEILSKTNRKRR